MTTYTHDIRETGRARTLDTAVTLLLAGAAGTVAFDLFGKAIGPLTGLGGLAPVGLARSTLGALGLPNGAPYGNLMHLLIVGLIAYPLGWAIVRTAQRRALPSLGWFPTSVAYGVGLWVAAIGFVAWFATGNFFLGFSKITWTALYGHVIYAVVAAAAAEWIARR